MNKQTKTILFIFTIIAVIFSISPKTTQAAVTNSVNDDIIYQDASIYITYVCTVSDSYNMYTINSLSRSTVRTSETTHIYKIYDSNSDLLLASYTLTASFAYNGQKSQCISVSHSTDTYASGWNFTSTDSYTSGNHACGSYTIYNQRKNVSHSDSVSIYCDVNGNIY